MQRRDFTVALLTAGVSAGLAPVSARAAALSDGDASMGVRTALERGAGAAVDLLGKSGGFDDPRVRIPLPGALDSVAKLAAATGQQARVDELVTAMNRAAEAAVAEAKPLLVSAVKSMSLDDARRIVTGGDNAATEFFAAKTREPLTVKFLPIVARETQKVALADKYDAIAGKVAGLGFMKKEDADLNGYVTGKALDGLFLMIGEEERKIRKDPIGTGSALLGKVFGGKN